MEGSGAASSRDPPPGPVDTLWVPDYRIIADKRGPAIISVLEDGAMSHFPSIHPDTTGAVVESGGIESPACPVNPEDISRTAGVVYDTGESRCIVSPDPSVLLVVRIPALAAVSLSEAMESEFEKEVLSTSHSYTTALPANFRLLPVRHTILNILGMSGKWNLQSQLLGVLRDPSVCEQRSPHDDPRRLGWTTRRHPGKLRLRRRVRRQEPYSPSAKPGAPVYQ
jgi:hypothetical protein